MSKRKKFYGSTQNLKSAIYTVKRKFKQRPSDMLGKLFFVGPKAHGSNASYFLNDSGITVATRNNHLVTLPYDNVEDALQDYTHSNKLPFTTNGKVLKELYLRIMDEFGSLHGGVKEVQVVGEYCGGNIQKRVGLQTVPKMFMTFAVKIIFNSVEEFLIDRSTDKTTDNVGIRHVYRWMSQVMLNDYIADELHPASKFFSRQLPVDNDTVDESFDLMNSMTLEIEEDCPIARKIRDENNIPHPESSIGEGCVVNIEDDRAYLICDRLIFKIKGDKHAKIKRVKGGPIEYEGEEKRLFDLAHEYTPGWRLDQFDTDTDPSQRSNASFKEYKQDIIDDIFDEEDVTSIDDAIKLSFFKSIVAKICANFYF